MNIKLNGTETPGKKPTSANVGERELALNLKDGSIYSMDSIGNIIGLGSGIPSEIDNAFNTLTSPTGKTGDIAWSPFISTPQALDKTRSIDFGVKAVIVGPFSIPAGMKLTVDKFASLKIL